MESWGPRDHEVGAVSSAAQTLTTQGFETQLYTELPSERHIRLISLASDTVSAQEILRCSFVEQDIREVIPWAGYNALSYVWGDSPERVTISCNGHMTFITRNLYNALKQIWKVTPKQVLWADALCINQDDDEEKGHQVSMMGDIYKTATTVLVWLGDDENTFARSWSAIGMAANEPGTLMDDSALDDFLAHPWFTRAWTLQEVLLARKAVLICGTRWIEWRLLFETIGPKGPLKALQKCTEIMQSEHRREEGQNPLKQLLTASSVRHATDPRDKLYALLGLLPQNSTRMRPDYTIPYRQLVKNFVIDQVRRYEDLWFLHACGTDWEVNRQRNGLDLGRSNEEQLSWVPDLLNPLSLKLVLERPYAPMVHAPSFRQETVQRTGNGRLRVHGIAVGIFQRLGADDSGTCIITAFPTCVVKAMSRGSDPARVELSLKGSVKNLDGHYPRHLSYMGLGLETFPSSSEVVLASNLLEHMALHLRQACPCLANDKLPPSGPKGMRGPHASCPISPKSVHCKIETGDLLCVLSNGDGLFALRHLPQRGAFRLVGSAFTPEKAPAIRETKVSCQWSIGTALLQFDLY